MLKIAKPQIIMTSFFAVAFLGTLPAIAELGTVWTDFKLYADDLRNYLTNSYNTSDTFTPVELQTQSAITSSSGDLNVPNPNYVGQYTRDQITQYSVSDKFENNPAVYGREVSSEINRYITRGAVEGVFGRDGQRRLKGKLENTENAVQESNKAANTAQQKYSEIQSQSQSQGAMCSTAPGGGGGGVNLCQQAQFLMMQGLVELELQNINIQREQTKITGETLGNTIQLRNDIQYSNLNLADISQQMNEVNRARRVGTSAEVARLLRVTSQTDLFRKSSNPLPLQTNPPASENNPSPTETNPPSSENIPSPLQTP